MIEPPEIRASDIAMGEVVDAPRRPRESHRVRGAFFGAKIPWDWLKQAVAAGPKGFHVAGALWHTATLTGSRTVRVKRKTLEDLKVSRQAYYRMVWEFELLGLVQVEGRAVIVEGPDGPRLRTTGKPLTVTIID